MSSAIIRSTRSAAQLEPAASLLVVFSLRFLLELHVLVLSFKSKQNDLVNALFFYKNNIYAYLIDN